MSESGSLAKEPVQVQTIESWIGALTKIDEQVAGLSLELDRLRRVVRELAAEVRGAVAASQSHAPSYAASIEAADTPKADSAPVDLEAAREEVRRSVEAARAELAAGTLRLDAPVTPMTDGIVREDAATAYAPVDAGFGVAEAHEPPAEEQDTDAVRDQVRRAVEAARAELAAGTLKRDEEEPAAAAPVEGDAAPAFSWLLERSSSQTPSIVIDDPEGTVELVLVYQALGRVGFASQAVLLDYTHHAVTIGINSLDMPNTNDLEKAVEAVFGRPARAQIEGARVTVRLMNGQAKAA
jgi:hypothetical protein